MAPTREVDPTEVNSDGVHLTGGPHLPIEPIDPSGNSLRHLLRKSVASI